MINSKCITNGQNNICSYTKSEFIKDIELGNLCLINDSVSIYHTYKIYKSFYKKEKTLADFIEYFEKAIFNYKFDDLHLNNLKLDLSLFISDIENKMKAADLKNKWQRIGYPVNVCDHLLSFYLDLKTTTGNVNHGWNLYDTNGVVYATECGRYIFSAQKGFLNDNQAIRCVDNDRINVSSYLYTIKKEMSIDEFKYELRNKGFSTFSKAFKSVSGKSDLRIYVLKTYISPETYFSLRK